MIEFSWWSLLKGGALFLAIGTLLLGVFLGVISFIKTGDPIPVLDSSIGMLLEGDSKAYQMEQDLINGKILEVPEDYRDNVRNAVFQTIFVNIFLNIFFMVLLYKFISWLWGSRSFEPEFDIMSVALSILVYVLITTAYTLIITWQRLGSFTINKYVLLAGVPIKSIVYPLFHIREIIALFGL